MRRQTDTAFLLPHEMTKNLLFRRHAFWLGGNDSADLMDRKAREGSKLKRRERRGSYPCHPAQCPADPTLPPLHRPPCSQHRRGHTRKRKTTSQGGAPVVPRGPSEATLVSLLSAVPVHRSTGMIMSLQRRRGVRCKVTHKSQRHATPRDVSVCDWRLRARRRRMGTGARSGGRHVVGTGEIS
jgi:hypothetical protein